MALLKDIRTEPPGGWKFFVKETRLMVKGESFRDLTNKVMLHRQHMKLDEVPRGTLELEIQRQICTRLSTQHCRAEGTADEWVPQDDGGGLLKLSTILAFSKALIEWLSSGKPFEDEPEAHSRALVCRDCPLNQPATGCHCGIFYKMVNAAIPKERRYDGLYVCGVCQCSTIAKVNVPMNVIAASEEGRNLVYPVHCWLHPPPKPE